MQLLALAARLAAAGAVVGFLLAGRDVAQQQYLAQGLSRTAVWMLSHGAALGVLVGLTASAAVFIMLLVWWWALTAGRRPVGAAPPEGSHPVHESLAPAASRFALFLGFITAAAVLLSPERGGPPGGPPYRLVMLGTVAVFWTILTGAAAWTAGADRAEGAAERWFRLRWATVAGLAFAVSLLHVWARARSWPELATWSLGSLVACLAAFAVLRAPARFLHNRLGQPMGRAWGGRFGLAMSVALLAGAVGVFAAGASAKARAGRLVKQRGRNVILIGLDTVRSDRVSLLSSDRPARDLSPNLRRLAARGTVFSHAIAQAPWTLPSFASILTGLYPEQHGAEHLTSTLPPPQLTIAELLREAGYRTMSVVSCEYLNAASGLGQGFDVLDESQVLGHRAITSAAVTDRALQLLEQQKEQPLFLFLHYFDPHFCYQDHQEYDLADGYDGWLREAVQNADQNAFRWMIFALGPAFRERATRVTDADRQFLRDAYDEEIAYTDSQLGRLFDYLDANDLWDSTLVIAVSDHGEELLERNWSGHAVTLYQELIRVPLVVAAPNGEGPAVENRPVELRAIFETIADFLDTPTPSQPLRAPSLLDGHGLAPGPVRSSTRPVAEPPAPGEFVPKYVWLTCVIDGRWKLIKDHLRNRSQLIDLEADPHEMENRSADQPGERRQLERELDRLDAEVGRSPAVLVPQASEEQQRRLKSLGYL